MSSSRRQLLLSRWVLLSMAAAAAVAMVVPASAQNAPTVQQATTFANTLAPRSAAEVVNPAGVNAAVWGTSTATPTTVPSQLGGFSAASTSRATLNSARTSSLTALGTQAMTDCANYVPGPNADPAQVQACAAVNFLTNQCLTPTTQQGTVLARVGASQVASGNCSGTYGAGARTFNLQNQITATDPVFTAVRNIGITAPTTVGSTCSTRNVVTSPAQFATSICTVQSSAVAQTCSQFLEVTVTPAQGTCSPGSRLVDVRFPGPVNGQDWASITANCVPSAGVSAVPFTFDGWGSDGSCSGPLNVNVDLSQSLPMGTNPPPVVGQVVPSWLTDCLPVAIIRTGPGCPACPSGNCPGQTCSATFHFVQWPGTVTTYSCDPGYTLDQTCEDGQPCVPAGTCSQCNGNGTACTTIAAATGWDWAPGVHLQQSMTFPVPGYTPASATSAWHDACTEYEAIAGHRLPTPTP